jgi:hypothetical protein
LVSTLGLIDAKIARERLLQAYDIHLQALGESHTRVGIDLILLAKQHDTDDIDTALNYMISRSMSFVTCGRWHADFMSIFI